MKLVIAAALAAAALAAPALAQAQPQEGQPFAAYFGNTLISKHADGVEHRVWLNPDKTFSIRHDGKVIGGGTYGLEGDKICLSMTGAPAGAAPVCLASKPYAKVGDTWPTQGPGGMAEIHTVVAGRD